MRNLLLLEKLYNNTSFELYTLNEYVIIILEQIKHFRVCSVNRTLSSLYRGSLVITRTVPLNHHFGLSELSLKKVTKCFDFLGVKFI